MLVVCAPEDPPRNRSETGNTAGTHPRGQGTNRRSVAQGSDERDSESTRPAVAERPRLRPERPQLRPQQPWLQLLLDSALQPQDSFGVQLGDARFGDPRHLPDLLQREAFVVIEADHDLLSLRQALYGADQELLHRLDIERPGRVGSRPVLERVHEGDLVAARAGQGPELVEGDDGRGAYLGQDVLELTGGHVELARDLVVARRAA